MPNLIHFIDLEEMIAEIDPAEPVRLNTHSMPIVVFADTPDVSITQVLVSLRQIQGQTILSWMYATGEYDAYQGEPSTTDAINTAEQSWEEAARIAHLVEDRLLAEMDSMKVRPGIIELGTAGILGTWPFLELIEEQANDGDNDSDDDRQVRSNEDDDEIPF